MKFGYLNIENAKDNSLVELKIIVIENKENNFIFSLEGLNSDEIDLISKAIIDNKFIDIEMFFIDDDNCPYFGPDYNFSIVNNRIFANYIN